MGIRSTFKKLLVTDFYLIYKIGSYAFNKLSGYPGILFQIPRRILCVTAL